MHKFFICHTVSGLKDFCLCFCKNVCSYSIPSGCFWRYGLLIAGLCMYVSMDPRTNMALWLMVVKIYGSGGHKDSSILANLLNSPLLLNETSTAYISFYSPCLCLKSLTIHCSSFMLENNSLPSSLASCQKQLVPVSFCQHMLFWFSPPLHHFEWSQPSPSDAYSLYPSSSSWKKKKICNGQLVDQ